MYGPIRSKLCITSHESLCNGRAAALASPPSTFCSYQRMFLIAAREICMPRDRPWITIKFSLVISKQRLLISLKFGLCRTRRFGLIEVFACATAIPHHYLIPCCMLACPLATEDERRTAQSGGQPRLHVPPYCIEYR